MGAKLSLITCDHDVINYEAGVSDEVLGQECRSCFRLLTWNFFNRDSSYKSGYDPQCSWCKLQPRLSVAEHTARLSEMNYNSEGTKRQRHADQEIYHLDRTGRWMESSEFLPKLLRICPRLYVKPGGIVGDLALYITGTPRPDWNNQSFRYLGYMTVGPMPEYSKYEFDKQRDILLRASHMGWRSVLLRFIENGVLTEEQCDKEFGRPFGHIAQVSWFKKLQQIRNTKSQLSS